MMPIEGIERAQYVTLQAIWITSLLLNLVLVQAYPLLNLILYVDLQWIIKDPFYPQSKRDTYYYTAILFSIIGGAVSCSLVYSLSDNISLQVVIFNLINMFFGVLTLGIMVRIMVQL